MWKSCEPRSHILDYFLSSVRRQAAHDVAARSSVESISARYCRFMIMLSAPGSRWASAIPTPTYVHACTRNHRAVTYVYVRFQPRVSSNPGFSNLSRFMNDGSSLSVRPPPAAPSSFLLIVPISPFHAPRVSYSSLWNEPAAFYPFGFLSSAHRDWTASRRGGRLSSL